MMLADSVDTSTVPCPAAQVATAVSDASSLPPAAPDGVSAAAASTTPTAVSAPSASTTETAVTQPPDAAAVVSSSTPEIATPPAEAPPALTAVVHFSEALPDPVGADTAGEFFELRNIGGADAQLRGWKVTSGKGKSFVFGDVMIGAGGYHAFPYSVTKVTLVNDAMDLTLFDDKGNIVDVMQYPAPVPEGKSYAIDDVGIWQWTKQPTPGGVNESAAASPATVIAAIVSDEQNTDDAAAVSASFPTTAVAVAQIAQPSAAAVALALAAKAQKAKAAASPKMMKTVPVPTIIPTPPSGDIRTALADLDGLEDGADVQTNGVVTVPTGRIGKSLFALQDGSGSGAYVRMYGRGLPALASGDRVSVTGKLARSDGQVLITTAPKNIAKLQTAAKFAFARRAIDGVDASDAALAVSLSGIVTAKGTGWVTIGTDDASAEIKALMPKGMQVGPVAPGDRADVRGVVHLANGSPELLVLAKNDLVIAPKAEEKSALAENTKQGKIQIDAMVPKNTPSQPILIAREHSSMPWYAGAASLGLIGGFGGYIFWRKRRNPMVMTEEFFETDHS